MDRRYWIILITIFAAGAVIYAFAQNATLNQTQATLTAAQTTVTAQSNALIAQNTAAAATQRAAATQAADAQHQAVMEAQSAAATALAGAVSDAHNRDATAQAVAVNALAQQAQAAQADALAQAQEQADSTQAAALMQAQQTAVAAQNEAVSSAYNDAATPYLATIQAVQNDAATAEAAAKDSQATLAQHLENESALQAALATAEAQLATVSSVTVTPVPTLSTTGTPTASSANPPTDWQRVVGKGVAMQLPPSYTSFDLVHQDVNALIASLQILGADFDDAVGLVRQNARIIVFFAYDNIQPAIGLTHVMIVSQDTNGASITVQQLADSTISRLPRRIRLLSNDLVQTGIHPYARLATDTGLPGSSARQIEYLFSESGRIWAVLFTTSAEGYQTDLPVFDQMIQTIELIPRANG